MSTSKITFLTNNLVEDADLSIGPATTINSQTPLNNLKLDFTTKVVRSVNGTLNIILDLGTTLPVDSVALCGNALLKQGLGITSATLKGSSTTDFSASTPITIDLNQKFNFGFKFFTSESHRYWLLELTNSAGVCEISNLYLGTKNQLLYNDFTVSSVKWEDTDNSKITKNSYGQKYVQLFGTQGQLQGDLDLVSSTDYDILNQIQIDHGKSKPFWFLFDPEGLMDITDSEFYFSGFFYLNDDISWATRTKGLYKTQLKLQKVV